MSQQYSVEEVFGPCLRDFALAFPGQVWLDGVVLREEGGGGTGVSTDWHNSLAEAIVEATDYAQEQVFHEAAPGGWPECPLHPNGHPLEPDVVDDRAWWICGKANETIAPVGELSARAH